MTKNYLWTIYALGRNRTMINAMGHTEHKFRFWFDDI